MKKAEMLNLKVGSKIENKKGQWIINEISFEVFEDGKYMYGSNNCENYQETQFDIHEDRKKVVRFYLHNSDTKANTLLRESTIKDCFKVVEY